MTASKEDPTEEIRLKASGYPGMAEGTACTQSSFKLGKKAFLFIGEQGGRYKAMFKLKASLSQATKLAETDPTSYEVGKFGWVTARFSSDQPMPKTVWGKWLDESYEQAVAAQPKRKTTKK